jgi:glycine oxidase
MMGRDAVIVGGGVIGLSIAYELARSGITATVLDVAELGRAASWAGAGIIAPEADRPSADPLSALRNLSVTLHSDWAQSLFDETGIDTGYRRSGGVDVAVTPDEEAGLRDIVGRWHEEGIAFERLEPGDFARVEPALNPGLCSAYFLPGRAQLRNPWHLRALIAACERRGVALEPHRPATGFATADGRIVAVHTASGPISCGLVVLAAGPWSEALLSHLGLQVSTPPVKGQIVLLRTERAVLSRIVEHGTNYLVPRDDGRILVGSTEEDTGFDTRSTAAAVRDLLDEALRLCPTLVNADVERSWAGLRPGNPDGRPFLGNVPNYTNLYVATGHKRAGLQLSPGTAIVLADQILGRPPRLDLAAFRVERTLSTEREPLFRS